MERQAAVWIASSLALLAMTISAMNGKIVWVPAPHFYFAWGCFRYFGLGPSAPASHTFGFATVVRFSSLLAMIDQ